jgi:hypothetical protein
MAGAGWPTPDQTLLLQAVVFEGDRAKQALEAWRARVVSGEIDRASVRLLPLLGGRLGEAGSDDPLAERARTESARALARIASLESAAVDAVRTLHAAGIPTCLLKGMALIARGYMPHTGRSMADCDVLVPADAALAARDGLGREGWQLEGRLDADLLPVRHAVPLRDASGRAIDLHWHVLAECCSGDADARFWEATQEVSLPGSGGVSVTTRTLCPADMLLQACVHGLSWSLVAPVRWVADAAMIVRGAGQTLSWERLVDQAERNLLVLPMIDALTFLRETLDVQVPGSVLERLRRVPVPRWARAEHRTKMRPRGLRRQVWFHWFRHRRLSASGSLLTDLVRAPAYVRRRWRVGSSNSSRAGQVTR